VGKRPRTVYTITAKGRRALEAWLGTPGEGPVLEFEQLLKVFFADQGTKADALEAVSSIKGWARQRNAENIEVARGYVAGTGPFPERVAVLVVVGRFLTDFADMVNEWADWANDTIEAWPDDPSAAEPDWAFMKRVARRDPEG